MDPREYDSRRDKRLGSRGGAGGEEEGRRKSSGSLPREAATDTNETAGCLGVVRLVLVGSRHTQQVLRFGIVIIAGDARH